MWRLVLRSMVLPALALLLPFSAQAQLVPIQQNVVTVSPASTQVGMTVKLSASRLPAGRRIDFVLDNRVEVALGSATVDPRGNVLFAATVPQLAPARYRVEAKDGTTVRATGELTILASLALVPASTTPRAGTSLQVRVDRLRAGSLVLDYAGERVLGPVTVADGSKTVKFVVPTDRPASLPANVVLKASNLVGRYAVNTGQTTLAVQPVRGLTPFRLSGASLPTTPVRRSARFPLQGDVDADADLPPFADVAVYHRDAAGRVSALGEGTTDAQGQFELEVAAPGVSSMTAHTARADGQVFGVVLGSDHDGRELHSTFDLGMLDAQEPNQLDLRFDLRGPQGEPIIGAVVELEPRILPNGFLTPEQRAAKMLGNAADDAGHWAQYENQVSREMLRVAGSSGYEAATLIAPGCPVRLNRQLTDGQGRARFLLDTSDLDTAAANDCRRNQNDMWVCTNGTAFLTVKVYAGHVGYGYLAPANGDYVPHQYELRYDNYVSPDTGEQIEGGQLTDYYPPNNVIATFFRSATIPLGLQKITQTRPSLGDIYIPGLGQTAPPPPSQALWFKPMMAFPPEAFSNNHFVQPWPGPRQRVVFERDPAFGGAIAQAQLRFPYHESGGYTREFVREYDQSYCGLDGREKWVADLPYFRYGTNQGSTAIGEIVATTVDGHVTTRTLAIPFSTPFDVFFSTSEYNNGVIDDLLFDEVGAGKVNAIFTTTRPGNEKSLPAIENPDFEVDAMDSSNVNYSGDNETFDQGTQSVSSAFLSDNQQMSARPKGVSDAVSINAGMSRDFGSQEFETLLDADLPLFYYTWGVPELAGVEAGADLFFRTQFRQYGTLGPVGSQIGVVHSRTEPKLEGGIDLYVDVDILFDLVDISADLVPLFGLSMPTVIRNNQRDAAASQACVGMELTLYWTVDLPCLFFDPVCNVIEDTLNEDNSAVLASHEEPDGCDYPFSGPPFRKGGASSVAAPARRASIAFDGAADDDGAGEGTLAYAADDGSLHVARGPVGEFVEDPRYTLTDAVTTEVETIYFAPGRTLVVWVEADKTYAGSPVAPSPRTGLRELIRSKHIRYRVCEGGDCGPIRDLTAPGAGEGGLALARCWAGNPGCPADGEVTLSFTRDTSGDFYAFRTRIFRARLDGTTGLFGAPSVVDGSGIHDSHSTVAYVGGTPVVAWAKNDGGHPDKAKTRRFAYRVIDGASPVRVPAGFPLGVSAISLAASGTQLGVALTAVQAGEPFVGNRHELHVARSTSLATGGFTVRKLEDQDGRTILATSPQLTVDSGGVASVNFRGVGFGPDGFGQSILPGDPLGFTLHVGDLAMTQTDYSATPVQVQALTNDGGGHHGAVFARDPSSGLIVSGAHFDVATAQRAAQIKGAADAADGTARKTLGVALAGNGLLGKAAVGGLQLRVAPLGPDFAFGPRHSTRLRGTPGQNVRVLADVVNRGRPWSPRLLQTAKLVASWDGPPRAGRAAASVDIGALAANELRRFQLEVPIPVDFGADETHQLHLAIVASNDVDESDAGDNLLMIPLNALPVPAQVDTVLLPGSRYVQLTWNASNDARVVGYKVYTLAADGSRQLLGSTPTHGFLDLSAQFGETRSYQVVSYSARGLVSDASETVAAMPYAESAEFAGFRDGFESP